MKLAQRRPAHVLAASLCVGLALPNAVRAGSSFVILGAATLGMIAASTAVPKRRLALLGFAFVLAGWSWGSLRLATLDRSPLSALVGTAERATVVVTGPPRRGRFDIRAPALVLRFGTLRAHESVLMRLPPRRAPPQGAIVDALGVVVPPRPPRNGFDERTWLRRHGMHVVLRVDDWRAIGRRGGLGGFADRLRTWLGRSVARGVHGERAAVLEGVVLGDDGGLSDDLRRRFRASGLYHLLAVSGQNVALVAGGALALAWLIGLPRWLGQVGALAGIGGYVLAVGAQPSVIRAGIAGALGSLAWLTSRLSDRWYFLLLGAIVLLAWNPYTLLDAGFELSFAAVVSIFLLVPRLRRTLDGYPLPPWVADVVALSAACGFATAPIMWFQFHAIPLLTIPANALAAPAMVPLLGLALASAAVEPFAPGATAVLAWLNGWLAAYLAACARIIGGLPGAQVRSGRAMLIVLACVFLVGAYAWPRWRPSSSPSI